LSFFLNLFLILILNSCVAYTNEDIQKRMTKKLKGFNPEKVDVNFNTLYKFEGLFKCSNNTEKIESTSDGKYDEYVYIYEDGKVAFLAVNISSYYERYVQTPTGKFDAVLFLQGNKTKIMRSQVFHSILGMDLGKGTYNEDIKLSRSQIVLQETKESCKTYRLIKNYKP